MLTIIDCHVHIGVNSHNLQRGIYPFQETVDNLLETMDTFGVSKAIVFPFPYASEIKLRYSTAYHKKTRSDFTRGYTEDNFSLQNIVNEHSDRLIFFLMGNPLDKDCVKNIKMLVRSGVRGVKLHPASFNYSISILKDNPIMKIIQDLDLIVTLHIGTGKENAKVALTLDHALEIAKIYPSVRFIFCHLGRLHRSLPDVLNLDNVLLDTSGLSLNRSSLAFLAKHPLLALEHVEPRYVIEWLVEAGYEDKLVWGSDLPYTDYEKEMDYILNARIRESARRKILSENIGRFLNLGGAS